MSAFYDFRERAETTTAMRTLGEHNAEQSATINPIVRHEGLGGDYPRNSFRCRDYTSITEHSQRPLLWC